MRKSVLVLALILSVLVGALPAKARAQEPVVEGLLFFSETCPHCHAIITEFLPKMEEKYGDSVSLEMVSVQDPIAYAILMQLDAMYGVPEDQRGGVPQIFIGSAVMIGRFSIEENFEKVVDDYLAKGGQDMPSYADLRERAVAAQSTALAAGTATPAAGSATEAAETEAAPPIAAAYFYKEGCSECERAGVEMDVLQAQFPQLQLEEYSAVENTAMLEWMGERYGVPEQQRLTSPAFFIGDDYLLGADVNLERMTALAQKYAPAGVAPAWEGWEQDRPAAEQEVVQRYRAFTFATLVGAGLIDGLNPCAFATLLFLVSYLTMTGRDRKQVLAAGGAFTLGVFAAYMALGFGLYQLVTVLGRYAIIAKVLYGLTAAIALVLAALSLYDFYLARRGNTSAMALKLPTRLRRWINRAIRERVRPGTTIVAALAVGVVVSSVELVCTGQVYLPTIMFVAGRPELRTSALTALTIYNLAFVVPLVAVFGVVAYGRGSERLQSFLGKNTAGIKLLTAAVLVALAVWLIALL